MKLDDNQRFVFQFWHAGIENAPPVVLSCIESWRKGCERIGFKHVVITAVDLDYWEAQFPESIRKRLHDFRHHAKCWEDAKWRRYSDMLRLALLNSFNGIWADATLLLMKPIENWLPDPAHAGGLQLCKGASEMQIESWFICSLGESQLLDDWLEHYVEFNLSAQRDASQYLAKKYSVPGIMFRIQRHVPHARTWWFSWVMKRFYHRHPYFAIYYSFEYVLRNRALTEHKYQIFLPYDLVGWSFFNSCQKPNLRFGDVNPTLLNSLMLLPFIKLDWKRSPQKGLEKLDDVLFLRFLWDTSCTQLG